MHDIIDELDKVYDIKTNILTDISDLGLYIDNNNGFIIFHLNIRSITKNFDQLLVMLNNNLNLIDCIVLTECWLNNCVINFEIHGFTSYTTKENNFNQNSGIVVFVSNKHKIIKVSEIFMDNCNCLNLSLCVRESAREIIAIYRVHNNIFNNFKTQLSELVNKIKTKRVIIIGDINIGKYCTK